VNGDLVISEVQNRSVRFTADELGYNIVAAGAGTVVELVDVLPEGWSVRSVAYKRESAVTSATGTVVLSIGVTGAATAIANAVDLEGAAGWVTPTFVRYDSTAPVQVFAQVTTATAEPTAVSAIIISLDLVKYKIEEGG